MRRGLRSLVPMGSNFFSALCGVRGKSALPEPLSAPKPWNQHLQPVGHREPGLQNITSPSWRCVRQGRFCPHPTKAQ